MHGKTFIIFALLALLIVGLNLYIILEPFLDLQKSKWSKKDVAISVFTIGILATLVGVFVASSPGLQLLQSIGPAGMSAGTFCVFLPPVRFARYLFYEFDGKLTEYGSALLAASFPIIVLFVMALCTVLALPGLKWSQLFRS